jgi:SAM-dependent methyltransferase
MISERCDRGRRSHGNRLHSRVSRWWRRNRTVPPARVAQYYDDWTDRYLAVGGDVIQACRTTAVEDLLRYTMASAGIRDGQRILDAGCGVCGPAAFFAQAADVRVEALTISPVQAGKARALCAERDVAERVTVRQGDYHELATLYAHDSFDLILFLESLGHAADPARVLREAHAVLKPGGTLYIKDFFLRETTDRGLASRMRTLVSRIRDAYAYNVPDLHLVLGTLRGSGFALEFVRSPSFADDIGVRAAFEARNGIRLFEGMAEFTPCEWLEIRARKLVDVAALR